MKTKDEVIQMKLEYYHNRVRNLEIEKAKLIDRVHQMERARKTNPEDKWYLMYLMKENASLARQCDDRQAIIEQYQKHYAKYGDFYTRWENEVRGPHDTTTVRNASDDNRGDSGYAQVEGG